MGRARARFRGLDQAGIIDCGFRQVDHVGMLAVALVAKAVVRGIRAWAAAIIAPIFAWLAITRLLLALLLAWLLITLLLITLLLIALLLLALPRLLLGGKFALRFGQQAGVMLGMLVEVFGGDTIIRQLRVAREEDILFNDLLRGAAHLAFGARAVEDAVDDIANGARAVRF